MKTFLKIKLKHLAAEAKINKSEKQKWLKKAAKGREAAARKNIENPAVSHMAESIHAHRVQKIRPEARDSNLAYGFLRGRTYAQIEPKRFTDPNWKNVFEIIRRFNYPIYGSNSTLEERFNDWKKQAPERIFR